jgi:hypothetical protein
MPKEVIYPPTPADAFQVAVGWSQDRDVQISVESVRGPLGSTLYAQRGDNESSDTEPYVKLGAAIRTAAMAYVPEPNHPKPDPAGFVSPIPVGDYYLGRAVIDALDDMLPFTGVHASMSREGINDLIRHLRRARDAAFGRDE